MQSPHKFIGIDDAGNKKVRTDLLLLDALAGCEKPVTTEMLIEIADPRDITHMKTEQVIFTLTLMLADGHVHRTESQAWPVNQRLRWQITEKGRAHLVACEAQDIFADCERYAGVKPTAPRIEEAPESYSPGPESFHERLRASHEDLDRRGVPPALPKDPFQVSVCNAKEPPRTPRPAIARVCLSEAELDDWWFALDVEAKAAAFCDYSLSTTIAAAEPRIPAIGTIGEADAKLFLRQNAGAVRAAVSREA